MNNHLNDAYVQLAQKIGYRSRAAFKLIEILRLEKLIFPGNYVVDLGASPGSWSQVIQKRLTDTDGILNGRIIALDLLPMIPIPGVEFIQGDFRDVAILQRLEQTLENRRIDVVVSDMVPNLSGVKCADSVRIQHVCELAMEFALTHIKYDGALLIKAFHGSYFSQIVKSAKLSFKKVIEHKPKASRSESSEVFLVARSLK
ncbi:MAG: RlmE family RNA methyltransferase [Bordetella sp.]|nr:MAG: RlmE family RNA methyltransferase [Bordetella sp.]